MEAINQATEKEISQLLNIVKSSPENGTIKVSHKSNQRKFRLGMNSKLRAALDGCGETLEEIIWVKISEGKGSKEPTPQGRGRQVTHIGLPELKQCTEK